jgi:hypothetical protein
MQVQPALRPVTLHDPTHKQGGRRWSACRNTRLCRPEFRPCGDGIVGIRDFGGVQSLNWSRQAGWNFSNSAG